MPYTTVVSGLAAALLAASMTGSAPASPPDQLAIDVVTVNGSGCPASTASVQVSPDNTSFRVVFSGYLAWTGPGAAPTDFRKNCQFSFQIDRPDGLTYAVEQAEYSGFAQLEDGVTAVQAAHYYFQGDSDTVSTKHEFTGPLSRRWHTTDAFDVAALRFAPCGAQRNLNVNTELRVQPGAEGLNVMVMDAAIDYQLTWRTCPS
jgi:hypothetical protein